jgi:acetylornithine deacetylase/succinyl-diaminopimelate desuccinylase-like protein
MHILANGNHVLKSRLAALDQLLDLHTLSNCAQATIELALAIQQIPAPTFAEQQRAAYVAQQFKALELHDIEIDSLYNVYGRLPGRDSTHPAIMVSAHTDTVFDQETGLQTRAEGDRIYGPGLGDNSIGVAGLIMLSRILRSLHFTPDCDLWLAANTREEGLGDLGGMKAAFHRLRDRLGCVVNIEGMAFGHVYHAGIAVRRLHITAKAEGGHSWLNFGRSSAIHGILQVGARIAALRPPESPRTTYNIGLIEGGRSINTIAAEAGLWLDLRSEDSATLQRFEQEARAQVEPCARSDLTFGIEVVGDRPAGRIAPDHPLVQYAMSALTQVGTQGILENGSTDANVPLASGCPAVTIGITRGGNAHRLDEYIEAAPVANGIRQLALIILALSTARIS